MTALYIGIAPYTVVNRGIVLTDDECERLYLARHNPRHDTPRNRAKHLGIGTVHFIQHGEGQ